MEITDEIVNRIATLSKLEFQGEAREKIKADMNKMLQFCEKLNAIDTEGVKPLIHMSDEVNVLREDVVVQEITQVEALKNAPKKDSYYFKVLKVIENPEA